MRACLDDLVIALYVFIDDLLDSPRRRGRPPRISDAELVCLAIAQVLLDAGSERQWLRTVRGRLGHLFPYIPQQPGYNKRLRALAPTICRVLRELVAASPSVCDRVRLLDSTPVPCAASRETVKRSERGRVRRVRLLRVALPVLLGVPAVHPVHPRRPARRLRARAADTAPDLPEAWIRRIVDLAHENGLKVACHTSGEKGDWTAIRSGVDSIEQLVNVPHDLSDEMIEAILDARIAVSATLPGSASPLHRYIEQPSSIMTDEGLDDPSPSSFASSCGWCCVCSATSTTRS